PGRTRGGCGIHRPRPGATEGASRDPPHPCIAEAPDRGQARAQRDRARAFAPRLGMSLSEATPPLPVMPAQVPQVPAAGFNRFTRWLGRSVLRLGGWRVVGEIPPVGRLVVIAAPHSSNWDGIWGMA